MIGSGRPRVPVSYAEEPIGFYRDEQDIIHPVFAPKGPHAASSTDQPTFDKTLPSRDDSCM